MRAILSTVTIFLVYQQHIHAQRLPICNCAEAGESPVCGSDGRDYMNMCALECANKYDSRSRNVKFAYEGPCKRIEPHPCFCTAEYNPVCGSDAKVYGNSCVLFCAKNQKTGLSLVDFGGCFVFTRNNRQSGKFESCPCPKIYRPICGSDGITYGNFCELGCANKYFPYSITLAYAGVC